MKQKISEVIPRITVLQGGEDVNTETMLVGKYDFLPQVSVQDTTHLGILDTDNIYKFEDGQYEYYLISKHDTSFLFVCKTKKLFMV